MVRGVDVRAAPVPVVVGVGRPLWVLRDGDDVPPTRFPPGMNLARFCGSKFGRPSPRATSAMRASRRVVGRVSVLRESREPEPRESRESVLRESRESRVSMRVSTRRAGVNLLARGARDSVRSLPRESSRNSRVSGRVSADPAPRVSAKRFARSSERAPFLARLAGVLADGLLDLKAGLLPARTVVLPTNLPAFGSPLTHVDAVSVRALRLTGVAAVPLRGGLPDLTRAGAADFVRGFNDMFFPYQSRRQARLGMTGPFVPTIRWYGWLAMDLNQRFDQLAVVRGSHSAIRETGPVRW